MAQEILGYTSKWIVSPGEKVGVKVSTTAPTFKARLCRVISGHRDLAFTAPEYDYFDDLVPEAEYPGRYQHCHIGSYAQVDQWALPDKGVVDPASGLTLDVWVFPTLADAGHKQFVLSDLDVAGKTGFGLLVTEDNEFALAVGTGGAAAETVKTGVAIAVGVWTRVQVTVLRTSVSVSFTPKKLGTAKTGKASFASFTLPEAFAPSTTEPLFVASSVLGSGTTVGNCFNGRIDALTLSTGSSVLARFDFSKDIPTDHVLDVSGAGLTGALVNAPTRAVKGFDWDGSASDWTKAAYGYGAIHFHEDDLDDARWEDDFVLTVPETARSGAYAVDCVTPDGTRDQVTFFVRPPLGKKRAPLAFLLGTYTYTAYANEHMFSNANDPLWQRVKTKETEDFLKLINRKDAGLAMYDLHRDGYGCVFSSTKRPVINVRPAFVHWGFDRPREFSADLFFIKYLERLGLEYDVLTDHDLNEFGAAALDGVETLVFNCHPEYTTQHNLQLYDAFAARGGNLMYLGGNGFYWVTASDPSPDRCHRIEVRRGVQGCRAFELPGGEFMHSMTGEQGGLWRARGRAPNYTFGIGSAACGLGVGVGFRRSRASYEDASVSWIFEGVGEEDVDAEGLNGSIGAFGGGASGDEIDRYDVGLGSPPDAVVLATSERHSDLFGAFNEEIMFPMLDTMGPTCDKVRSDMVYFEGEGGGSVFSVGSINWIWTMAYKDYDNNVARLTANVLREFTRRAAAKTSKA